jgi:subtilisin family serine protease
MTFDPNDISGRGYRVYPESLRKAADDVAGAADLVTAFAQTDLAGTLLGEFDLGLPGTSTTIMPNVHGAGTAEQYNRAIDTIRGVSAKNAEALQQLAQALQTAASYYEQQDAAEYERLKKLEGGLP